MPRPPKCRTVNGHPAADIFKPAGIRKIDLEEVVLPLDEFEAVRLADLEGLYQDDAATSMGVSRQTFGNILTEAHRKIADCLVNGKALRIEGGSVNFRGKVFQCGGCARRWMESGGAFRPEICPSCGGTTVGHAPGEPGRGCGKRRKRLNGDCV